MSVFYLCLMKHFNGFGCRARKVLQCLKLQNLAKSVLHSFFMGGMKVAQGLLIFY